MRALVLTTDGPSVDTDRLVPVPAEGEALVRVLRAGICETDLQLIAGYMAFSGVLGHEFVGVAESGVFAGQRVVSDIHCSCWTCDTCRSGMPKHCPRRTTVGIAGRDGAFADYVAVPQRNLHLVPDSVSTDAAVFTEPLAAAFQVPAQTAVHPDDHVVVLGDGRLGNLCAQVLSRFTRHLVVVGKHPEKLTGLRALGVATALLCDVASLDRSDIVVDCTGSVTGLTTALALVRPRGTIVLKTTIAGRQSVALAPIVVDEVTIVGSRCGPFDRAIEALAAGDVQVLPLISDRFELSRGLEALERAAAPGVLKVLLDISAAGNDA